MNSTEQSNALTPSQRQHLEQEYSELQGKYQALTKDISALDTDIGRTPEAFRRQPIEDIRTERVAERDQVASRMALIERQLGRGTGQTGQAAEPSMAATTTPAPATPPVTPTAGTTPQNQPPAPSKRGPLGWFHQLSDGSKAAVIVAVITGIFTVVVALISLLGDVIPPPNGPGSTPSPLAYVVRVEGQDSAGTRIKDAKVTLEVPGRPPLDTFADNNGVAVLTVPAQYVGGQAVMIVEAAGFAPFRQNIAIDVGSLPPLVRLERLTQP